MKSQIFTCPFKDSGAVFVSKETTQYYLGISRTTVVAYSFSYTEQKLFFFVLMPAAPECRLSHHGRIMKCVTFLLLLPETLKKLKRASKHPGRLSVCYNILTLSLKKRMAAELYPVNDRATVQKNGTVMLSLPEKKSVEPVAQTTASIAATPTTEQNINNNNVEIPSWHSAHPTLRERQDIKSTDIMSEYVLNSFFFFFV